MNRLPRRFDDGKPRPAPPPALDVLCAEVLSFLAADPERLDRFFTASGMAPADLRRVAREAGFAESLLDHLAADDRLFLVFATEHGYDPGRLAALHASLAASDPEV